MSFLTDIKHWYGAWQLRRSDIEMRRKHQAFNIDSAKRITILFDGTEPEDIKLVKAFVGKLSNGKEMVSALGFVDQKDKSCLLYTSPSPRDATLSRMPSSA